MADKRWFTGLPSPAAAALVAGMIWVFNDYQVRGGDVKWFAAAVTIYAGVTMVSSVKFYSGKDINLRRAMPFSVALVLVLALLLISIEPPIVLWGVMLAYGVSGYVGGWCSAGAPRPREKQYEPHPRGDRGGQPHGARAHARDHAGGHRARRPTGRRCSWSRSRRATCRRWSCWWRAARRSTRATPRARRRSPSPSQMGFQEAVEVLLAAGADPNVARPRRA